MKTVICSHGFGVDATGRGLFTDIAAAFPDVKFVMFGYNTKDEQGNMTVQPLPQQAELLNAQLAAADGEVMLLCHSQGCVTACLADTSNVSNLIFLAPPQDLDITRFSKIFGLRPGAQFNPYGMSSLPRRDGTTTYVGKDYLQSIAAADVQQLFKVTAAKHPVTIISAADDEIVGPTEFPDVPATVMIIPGSHDFTGEARQGLIEQLKSLL